MAVNPINIEILEALDAIDRRGSFAKAAEELNKATSALSYAIQKLEEQLDITVFQREGRRSVLTPAGKVLLADGREILAATRALAERAQEVATGWEPSLRIALESTSKHAVFFAQLNHFLTEHPGIEIDICESVLSGGWEALENDRVDLIVGAPGPVPQQKGFRAVEIAQPPLIPVIAANHPLSRIADDSQALQHALPGIRRVVTHDTATVNIARSAGLSVGKQTLYVQTVDQKIQAQRAGLGIGHLPKHRIQAYLDNGELIELALTSNSNNSKSNSTSKSQQAVNQNYIAWKLSHKGKALRELSQRLIAADWG